MNVSLNRGSIVCIVLLGSSMTLAAEPDRKALDFFESKIRPMLVEHCYQCHSSKAAASKTLKGKLQVDTREGLRIGGESGPAVVPGKPEESLLIAALKHESLKMPPNSKLPDSLIKHFEKWIADGAVDPRDGQLVSKAALDIEAGRKHWAFQPIANVTPPQVRDTAGVRTPVDQFIRAKQEAAKLGSNSLAGAHVLIRRAYFDLVGLPPTLAELDKWTKTLTVTDGKQPGGLNVAAYEQLVDELLHSPHFGERWARHWLDLARFAESNGYAFDQDRPNAYHYRDFVIKAFNSDMPYDEFVRQQVAGDLLAKVDVQTNAEAVAAVNTIAATGFLVAGPFTTQQTQKERERSRYEQLDDTFQTLGTSLLGLTTGCCRCHDHKYDPLPVHDYYRMVSCFSDVGFSDVGINMHPEQFREAKAKFDVAHAPLTAALAKFEKDDLPGRLTAWVKNLPKEQPLPKLGDWHHVGPFVAAGFDQAFAAASPPEKKVDLAKTYDNGKLKWTKQSSWKDGTVHNTLSGDNASNYLYREIEAPESQVLSLSLGSDDAIKVFVNGKEVLANKTSRGAAADQEKISIQLNKGRNQFLMKIVNASGPTGFYFKALTSGPPANVVGVLKLAEVKWNAAQRKLVADWYQKLDADWTKLNSAVVEHQKQEPKPTLTNVYSAKVRGTTYSFGEDTYKVYFLRRGNADNKEGEASPGFLQVLTAADQTEQHWIATGSKNETAKPSRVALADWLSDTQHGAGHLLARVIVNRLWQHHFGRGIVATPSDFGTRGDRPTHPQLLDWLAAELIRGGWKLKPIHKLIMTSGVYMQGGGAVVGAEQIDPENRLLWRHESRRLEAEIIRDALLAVSGKLDRTQFGKGTLDTNSNRRSVYFTVKRGQLIPLLQLFDAPDAMQGVGRREESTVAPQALALLNSPVIRGLAAQLGQQIRPDKNVTVPQAIDRAYRQTFSRSPTANEVTEMSAFIDGQVKSRGMDGNAETLAVRDFCHILLCMNEFVYVD
ncbi:MAG: PSD1 and planctomycete cytochrome C domain-containing protein [Planctomycetota bacterium]|nr:PSD1 and planctomycete cytochrome C domain-containing protein [Planctomycetota bacterium]